MKLVVDSSSLRDRAFEEFLAADPENRAVITEVTAFESYKGDPVTNAARNYRICARYPQQVVVLRPVVDIMRSERRGALGPDEYVDTATTALFAEYCRLLARAHHGDASLRAQLAALGIQAAKRVEATRVGVPDVVAGILALASEFSPSELAEVRTRRLPSGATLHRTMHQVLGVAAASLAKRVEGFAWPALSEALQTYAFRYGVTSYMLGLWWIRNGDARTAPAERLCNDVLDMQQAAFATRLDGILTRDQKLQTIFDEAQVYLAVLEELPK